jgi:hypothetical protein
MRFLPDADERAYKKARKRLQQVLLTRGVFEVRQWANTSLWAVQEALEANRPEALPQARLGIVGVLAAVDTLLDIEG